jgi:hypothetical protein
MYANILFSIIYNPVLLKSPWQIITMRHGNSGGSSTGKVTGLVDRRKSGRQGQNREIPGGISKEAGPMKSPASFTPS